MNKEIASLEPQILWQHFSTICEIPRPSGHLEKITRYIMEYGKSLGLETLKDDAGNVLIRKPATSGMESRRPVILQAHLDIRLHILFLPAHRGLLYANKWQL